MPLRDLILLELADLYDTSHRLLSVLRTLREDATDPDLIAALHAYDTRIRKQILRLETAFRLLGEEPQRTASGLLDAILEENAAAVERAENALERDRAIALTARRAERYAVTNYGAAATFATMLDREDVALLLRNAFDEEELAERDLLDL